MTKWVYRVAIAVGCALLGVSAVLYVLLDRAASAEQALSPGAESFGVAVLGMMYRSWHSRHGCSGAGEPASRLDCPDVPAAAKPRLTDYRKKVACGPGDPQAGERLSLGGDERGNNGGSDGIQ